MQSFSLFFVLGNLAFAAAAPQPLAIRTDTGLQSLDTRTTLAPPDTLYVTFWKYGCGPHKPEESDSSTNYINESQGNGRPGDCMKNNYDGWTAIEIRQPEQTWIKYSVELFSGEGCNNPLYVSRDP